ncbi:hypothetical protein T484DRAFT_2187856 [Baffinella frigidus]|nr:hypothetical protein T484DRAFT_2187856 [Cryptophyta sp. CCMP2293]
MDGISESSPLAKPARLAPLSKNPASKASVEHFFREKKIKELLQDLTSDLAVNQPDDPSRYLYEKIGSFFGLAPPPANAADDVPDMSSQRSCSFRVHVECVGQVPSQQTLHSGAFPTNLALRCLPNKPHPLHPELSALNPQTLHSTP